MTSRSFCSKEESRLLRMMTKEKMRRSLWAISLCTLAFFFMLTVPTIMGVQQGLERRQLDPQAMESIYSMLSTIVGRHNVFVTLATVAMAVLLAAVSFRYMHNKKQVDFYHSLPIRRPWLFLANFLAGLFGFLFAYLLNLVLSLGIIFCSGFGKALSGPQVLGTMALHLVFFLAVYALSIAAHQLAGTTATGLLCNGFLLALFPAALGLTIVYGQLLYRHWYLPDEIFNRLGQWLSPLWSYFTMSFSYNDSIRAGMVLYWLLWALVLGGVGMFLYTRRPSESAGKAVAFSRPAAVLKYIAVILCTLAGGVLFRVIGVGLGWQIFGFFCGGIISHCVLEVIYNLDFKKIFCHIKGLGICGVCFAALYTGCHMDLFGYDKFLPTADQVKAVSLMSNENEDYVLSVDETQLDTLYRQTYRQPENIQAALELCASSIEPASEESGWDGARIWVCYQMNSGRKVYRSYFVSSREAFLEQWATLYDSREYKENYYPIFQLKDSELQSVGCWQGEGDYTGFVRQQEQAAALAETLREETLNLTVEQLKHQAPVAILEWGDDPDYGKEGNYSHMVTQMPVYPSMEKTLALMEEYGIYQPGAVLNLDEIQGVWLWSWDKEDAHTLDLEEDIDIANVQDSGDGDVYVTDKEQIARMLEKAVLTELADKNPYFEEDSVRARFVLDENMGYSVDCVFPAGEFPLQKK